MGVKLDKIIISTTKKFLNVNEILMIANEIQKNSIFFSVTGFEKIEINYRRKMNAIDYSVIDDGETYFELCNNFA